MSPLAAVGLWRRHCWLKFLGPEVDGQKSGGARVGVPESGLVPSHSWLEFLDPRRWSAETVGCQEGHRPGLAPVCHWMQVLDPTRGQWRDLVWLSPMHAVGWSSWVQRSDQLGKQGSWEVLRSVPASHVLLAGVLGSCRVIGWDSVGCRRDPSLAWPCMYH